MGISNPKEVVVGSVSGVGLGAAVSAGPTIAMVHHQQQNLTRALVSGSNSVNTSVGVTVTTKNSSKSSSPSLVQCSNNDSIASVKNLQKQNQNLLVNHHVSFF
jgi:hypothetical protein